MQDERKQAERDLDKIYNLTTDIICIADLHGRYFKKVNPAFTRILGFDPEEIYRRPILSFIHSEDKGKTLAKIQEELNTGAATVNFSNRYQHRNGTYVWIEWTTKPIPEEGITYAIGRDITERKRMEQELLKLQKLESIGILAGGIAHDFNNLLTAIMGNISFSRMLVSSGDKVSRLLADAEQACVAAKELSYRLLTFSRGGDPIRKPVSTGNIIRECLQIVFDGSGILTSADIPGDLPFAEADEEQIRQVINSLLINAREAMPGDGRVDVQARLISLDDQVIAMLPAGSYIKIVIEDSGQGIPEEILSKIFDPYFSTKGMCSQKGRGLGLAICHSIIRKHDGTITAESGAGKGAAFSVYLPVTVRPAPSSMAVSPVNAGHAALNGRILVMDDDERISAIVREMLQYMKYDAEIAPDGDKAVERYIRARETGQPFALVVLDLTVPGGMGGIDTLKKLREIDPCVRAIVSSGYTENQIMRDFRAYGFAGAIAKPYNLQQLEQKLSEILERA